MLAFYILPYSVIGFSCNSLMTVEEQQTLSHVHVQFYSGASDLLLEYFDVQFRIQVSEEGSATKGMFLSTTITNRLH